MKKILFLAFSVILTSITCVSLIFASFDYHAVIPEQVETIGVTVEGFSYP